MFFVQFLCAALFLIHPAGILHWFMQRKTCLLQPTVSVSLPIWIRFTSSVVRALAILFCSLCVVYSWASEKCSTDMRQKYYATCVVYIIIHSFYIALFSALDQTLCAHEVCWWFWHDWFFVFVLFFSSNCVREWERERTRREMGQGEVALNLWKALHPPYPSAAWRRHHQQNHNARSVGIHGDWLEE